MMAKIDQTSNNNINFYKKEKDIFVFADISI